MSTIDNILNKIILGLLVFIMCIMLIIGSFFVFPSVFADDSGKCYYYEGLGSSDTPTKVTVFNTGNVYLTYSTGVAYFASAFECHYAFYDNGTAVGIVLGVEEINGNKFFNAQIPDSEIQSNSISGNASVLNFSEYSNGYYFATTSRNKANGNTELSSWIEPYASVDDAVSALAYGIEFGFPDDGGGGGLVNDGNAIIVVNPGNAAYIRYDSATFNFLINLDKPVSNINSNARYGFASDLPSGSITLTPSTGNPLPLRKSIPDILGRSATWVGSVDTETIGYFIVYNPVYDNNGNANKPIRVTVTEGYMGDIQFPLTATDIGGEIVSTGSSDDFYISDGMQGSTDLPSYIYSQTTNGVVVTSSALTVPVTPYNYVETSAGSAESGLQGFINQILELLSAPVKYIQTLYDSASSFFNCLTSLWTWLPPEVTAIIGPALAVLVVIGVIKFLWK